MGKILVTGADGFIGSHLTEALVRAGYDVRAFVYYNSFNSWGWLENSPPEMKKSIDVYSGDIRDPFSVKQAMRGCDAVLNLAALIAIPYSYIAGESYVQTNINGVLNVLEAARDLNFRKIVQVSTSEVYGTAKYVPITEEHPLNAQSPYAATKIAADQLALSYHKSFNLPVTVVRPFNTYGPRQSARAIIPTVISQIATGNSSVKVGALTPMRNFNYVQDIVAGFISAVSSEDGNGEVIQLGSEFDISVGDLVELISEIMGKKIVVESDNQRLRPEKSEVQRLCASYKKAKTILDWEPKFDGKEGLIAGLKETIAWFSKNENLANYKTNSYNI